MVPVLESGPVHRCSLQKLQAHVKSRLAAYKYPREIEYVADMETTTSGKLNRKLLRELEERRKGKV